MEENGHETNRPSGPEDRVIVGIDGSPGSQLAMDWAATKQDTLGPVVPVAAYDIQGLVDGVGSSRLYVDLIDSLRLEAEANVTRARDEVPAGHQVADQGQVIRGHAGPSLVRAAKDRRLLVVGTRGRSALLETLLGSVASYCVKHSEVPVAVIPPDTPVDEPLRHIVVGVDGSPNADAALRWAAAHVAPGGRLTAVTCREPAPYALELVPPPQQATTLRSVAQQAVDRAIPDVVADEAGAGVTVEIEVADGDPRVALRDRGAEADLLVVGSRGHRGAAYLLLGSVATSLAHHPTVPTVVVPADE